MKIKLKYIGNHQPQQELEVEEKLYPDGFDMAVSQKPELAWVLSNPQELQQVCARGDFDEESFSVLLRIIAGGKHNREYSANEILKHDKDGEKIIAIAHDLQELSCRIDLDKQIPPARSLVLPYSGQEPVSDEQRILTVGRDIESTKKMLEISLESRESQAEKEEILALLHKLPAVRNNRELIIKLQYQIGQQISEVLPVFGKADPQKIFPSEVARLSYPD